MIKLNKSAGKCNCQLRVFVLPAYKAVLKLNKLISFSVLTSPVNMKMFERTFEGISFLTRMSTETGAVTQRVSKLKEETSNY